MIERAVTFGPQDGLVGILFQPSESERAASETRPAVLIWNAGLLHRVGPGRLYVDLCRDLAGLGFPSLRFDLSGVGDSASSGEQRSVREQAVADIRAAMDFASSKCGAREFILIGLCSGADHAHAAAVADERVRGLVCMDGYAYPTLRFRLRRYAGFLSSPRRVFSYLKRTFARPPAAGEAADEEPGEEDAFAWTFPPRQDVERNLLDFIARGMHLLYVYTGEMMAYNYADQFEDMFALGEVGDRVRHVYMGNVDHVFSLPGARDRILNTACAWAAESFPRSPATVGGAGPGA